RPPPPPPLFPYTTLFRSRATSAAGALGPTSARLAASRLATIGRSGDQANELLEERHAEVADRVVDVLGTLRGGAMKIGQLASFRSEEHTSELQSLRHLVC